MEHIEIKEKIQTSIKPCIEEETQGAEKEKGHPEPSRLLGGKDIRLRAAC